MKKNRTKKLNNRCRNKLERKIKNNIPYLFTQKGVTTIYFNLINPIFVEIEIELQNTWKNITK
ncbi:hypothetical protein BXU11_11530 [Flavobacterium sp. LM5]|nr:hypothetical protein BXU11_11530 [Flavobacterium sp. LM5]